jgi:hypothetical protein
MNLNLVPHGYLMSRASLAQSDVAYPYEIKMQQPCSKGARFKLPWGITMLLGEKELLLLKDIIILQEKKSLSWSLKQLQFLLPKEDMIVPKRKKCLSCSLRQFKLFPRNMNVPQRKRQLPRKQCTFLRERPKFL